MHIDGGNKKDQSEEDEVDDPVDGIHSEEEVDDRHDKAADGTGKDDRDGGIHVLGEASDDAHHQERTGSDEEGHGNGREEGRIQIGCFFRRIIGNGIDHKKKRRKHHTHGNGVDEVAGFHQSRILRADLEGHHQ